MSSRKPPDSFLTWTGATRDGGFYTEKSQLVDTSRGLLIPILVEKFRTITEQEGAALAVGARRCSWKRVASADRRRTIQLVD